MSALNGIRVVEIASLAGAFAGKLKEAGLESEARYYLGLDHFRTRDPHRGSP